MRLILSNPHIQQYGVTVAHFLIRRAAVVKYTYTLDFLIKNKNRPVAFFIDGTRSSFNELGLHCRFSPKLFAYLELKIWLCINGVNPFCHAVYFSVKDLDPRTDIIFNYSFTTLDAFSRNNNAMQFHEYRGAVVNHLTHYFCGTRMIRDYIKKIPQSILAAESDLSRNEFFKEYFPDAAEVCIVPFAYAERFVPRTPFGKRMPRCFAIGTISHPRYAEFIDYFGVGTALHPLRQMLYEKKGEYAHYIDCFIESYDAMRSIKDISSDDSLFIRYIKKHLPSFLVEKFVPNYTKQYFNYDIVEKYNEYQMFVSPEEIVGLPSVNFVEGMACGCAFFGIDDPMYTDIGLKPDIHYISYEKNNSADLIEKIKYYQIHLNELQKIAHAGCQFVRTHFSRKKVAEIVWRNLETMHHSFAV